MTTAADLNPTVDKSAPVIKRLYVGGLKYDVDKADLEARFKSFGNVLSVDLPGGGPLGGSRGFGFIGLETTPSALARCLTLYNGTKWKGMQLHIEEAKQDYMTRLKREWAEKKVQDEARAKGEVQISNKKRKRKAVEVALDMNLVTDRNAKNRKGWKNSRFNRAVAVFHYRDKLTGKIVTVDPLRYKDNLKRPESYAKFTPVARLTWPSDDIVAPPRRASIGTSSTTVDNISVPAVNWIDDKQTALSEESKEDSADEDDFALPTRGGLFDSTDDEDGSDKQDSDDESIDFNRLATMEVDGIDPVDTAAEDDAFETVTSTHIPAPLPAGLSDDDEDDDIIPTAPLPPVEAAAAGDPDVGNNLAKERSKLLGLAKFIIGNDSSAQQDNTMATVDFTMDVDDEESQRGSPISEKGSDMSGKDGQGAPRDTISSDNETDASDSEETESEDLSEASSQEDVEDEESEKMQGDDDSDDEGSSDDSESGESDVTENSSSSSQVVKTAGENISIPDAAPEHPQNAQDSIPEKGASGPPAERHYAVNTNLRALVFGTDGAGTFSLFGGRTADDPTETEEQVATPSASVPLFKFADAGPESVPYEQAEEPYDEAEVSKSFGTSTMFFFHLGDEGLSHRSKYAPDKSFMRTETVEEIKSQWEQFRQDLTHEFKSKHKLASRRKEKMRRQRGKIRAV
ncbi:uncharacterized protein SPPG_03981 [Spizellomyces punctatus DAOM BR117]|uniref:RRM domain-containing protein n=1 Tax=Spizellomyces punctatus (strain DAOM BR117) TaxID=645134 RepID=A0A0L0HJ05_SPIPD|nr:uncharacterized protein SPPG_03981 [Spizellomyces punctatus DAOM BR117]KND00880.1 hypothetical protein SPPG_03981 [Spizellomyces punctatus DAOM BR117]|eukprot:XP_016608919.1 hypothetical protein SPPG_03981 [Spizellomyces punctatus DAOM BR117]